MIVSLFDRSQNVLEPWARAGYSVRSYDIEPCEREMPLGPHTQCNVLDIVSLPPETRFVVAFPPCTHVAVSGARYWKSKGPNAVVQFLALWTKARSLSDGIPSVFENPIGRASRLTGDAWSVVVNPWEFSALSGPEDHYTKATCLWLFHGARAPMKAPGNFPLRKDYIHRIPPSSRRAYLRSVTPLGFSRGLFYGNISALRGPREDS